MSSDFTRSRKVILAHIFSREKLKIFHLSGNVYYCPVKYFVTALHDGPTALEKKDSTFLSGNNWYYNPIAGLLYLRCNYDYNPLHRDIIVTYCHFFANAPLFLTYEGVEVEYQARVSSIGELKVELDYENTGIALESNSSITLEATDSYFDDIFDTHIWENQVCNFYKFDEDEGSKLVYSGHIDSKSFSPKQFKLNIKDTFYKLRDTLPLPLFSDSDGRVTPSLIGKPKRRIYGRADYVQCVGLDNALKAFPIAGTISGEKESRQVIGVDTLFLRDCSPGDTLNIVVNDLPQDYKIDKILSDTELEISEDIKETFVNKTVTLKTDDEIPSRHINRYWHLAGHKLRTVEVAITEVIDTISLRVASAVDLFAGDLVTINGQTVYIYKLNYNRLTLNQELNTPAIVGDLVVKHPITNVFFGSRELQVNRDYTFTNTTQATINLNPLAEVNITLPTSFSFNLYFTNGSRTVTTLATVDLKTILKTRDWVRSNDITHTDWYEVLAVDSQEITLRIPYVGSTRTSPGQLKNVTYIGDEALITAHCQGMEYDGEWVKTASDAVKQILKGDMGETSLNLDSFAEARSDGPQLLSLVIPEAIGDASPTIRDTITLINQSVFGSLVQDQEFKYFYSVLNADKDEDLELLQDDDVISWDASTSNKIISKVGVSYAPFKDVYLEDEAVKYLESQNTFVDNMVGITNKVDVDAYLYWDEDARIFAERYSFFKSLSNTLVKIKGKLNLLPYGLNNKIQVKFDRLFRRYGTSSNLRIGIVNYSSFDGANVTIQFNDMSGVFNRVGAIAPNTQGDYSDANESEIAKYSFIVDNNSELPTSTDEGKGANLIG